MCPQGITYIYYQLERTYDSDKRYTIPVATTIGKVCMDNPDMMIPNDKYLAYFPDAPLPESLLFSMKYRMKRTEFRFRELKNAGN